MQLFELKGFPIYCIFSRNLFFFHMQGLLVSTIFCFFNGEVSNELDSNITDGIFLFQAQICNLLPVLGVKVRADACTLMG